MTQSAAQRSRVIGKSARGGRPNRTAGVLSGNLLGLIELLRGDPEISRETKKLWLGDLDSNQGCPVQSREFYR